ncbi:hypothetical protein ANO11243_079090 [Dothideomycetidae sp. 11243]|nr:hypothetical protein ANO11243_079090 [fungal sp. No.11243]
MHASPQRTRQDWEATDSSHTRAGKGPSSARPKRWACRAMRNNACQARHLPGGAHATTGLPGVRPSTQTRQTPWSAACGIHPGCIRVFAVCVGACQRARVRVYASTALLVAVGPSHGHPLWPSSLLHLCACTLQICPRTRPAAHSFRMACSQFLRLASTIHASVCTSLAAG